MIDAAERFADEIDAAVGLVEAAMSGHLESSGADALQARLADPETSRFAMLTRMLNLSRPERCLLLCLIAQHANLTLDGAMRDLSATPYVHEAQVRQAFRLDRFPIYTSVSALNLWQLARARDMGPGAPLAFDLDLAVIEWLAGKPGLDPELLQRLTRLEGHYDGDGATEGAASRIRLSGGRHKGVICALTGAGAPTATQFAADVAAALKTRLWSVRVDEEPLEPEEVLRLHRFVTVQNAALLWQDPERRHLIPRLSPSARLQFAIRADVDPITLPPTHVHLSVEVPSARRDALRGALRERFPAADEHRRRRVAAIRGVTRRTVETATSDDIDAFTREALERSTRGLTAWTTPLRTDVGFADLVLDPSMKERMTDLVAQIRNQHILTETPEVARVYAQERALTILLQGPPGTGKTLSARVLAGEAGLPLFRVDVASLVSKWRGETNKNLREMFRAASGSGAILFVDEVDAFATRRTDGRTEVARADNQNTAYLLQLIETAYDGTAVFATNRPNDVDEAMLRRIRHTLDFQPPGEEERARLWRLALAPFETEEGLSEFAGVLAPAFEFSGARIKAVVLNAHARLASGPGGPISLDALRGAALAEARQNGRLPGRREMARVLSFGDAATLEEVSA